MELWYCRRRVRLHISPDDDWRQLASVYVLYFSDNIHFSRRIMAPLITIILWAVVSCVGSAFFCPAKMRTGEKEKWRGILFGLVREQSQSVSQSFTQPAAQLVSQRGESGKNEVFIQWVGHEVSEWVSHNRTVWQLLCSDRQITRQTGEWVIDRHLIFSFLQFLWRLFT